LLGGLFPLPFLFFSPKPRKKAQKEFQMKLELFVNSIFRNDKTQVAETVACRLRGIKDGKSFKIPASCFSELPSQHDGLLVEVTGDMNISGNYVTPSDAKVLQVVKGAGAPASQVMSAEDYLASLVQEDRPF
jgi:hypothetical protein